MVCVQDFQECPQCHNYDIKNLLGLVLEYQTRDGTVICGCTVCGFGFQTMWVNTCVKCGLDFNMLLSSLDDAWMLEYGDGVKACPVCGCTQMTRELTEYNVGAKWCSIPQEKLRPFSKIVSKEP